MYESELILAPSLITNLAKVARLEVEYMSKFRSSRKVLQCCQNLICSRAKIPFLKTMEITKLP